MYRPLSKRQKDAQARKLEAMQRGKDRARMERPAPGRMPELPELRRVVTVTDYDSGQPMTKELRLFRTKRVDVFRVEAGGMLWKCCGWSVALEGLRKAYPRVPSPRSDFWATE
jgi:hypothetical protein